MASVGALARSEVIAYCEERYRLQINSLKP